MTERKWLTCTDPSDMLDALKGPSVRKLRLYAIACCRGIWPDMSEAGRDALEVAERHVHGLATGDELETACSRAVGAFRSTCTYGADTGHQPTRAAASKGRPEAIIHHHLMAFQTRRLREQNAPLVRDIFPFRPPAVPDRVRRWRHAGAA